jgi:hypothetical protein
MSNPIVTLRELHRLRKHVRHLRDELERAPRLLKAQEARLARAEESLRLALEDIKKAKVQTHEKETELKGVEQQIAKYEQQRNQAMSKKEYDAFNAEINAARNQCRKLEDQILDCMSAVEERTGKLPELEAAVRKAKEELAQFHQTNQARQASLTEELTRTQAELAQVEQQLPADVRDQYSRLVNHRGEDALSLVQEKTCSACYTGITAQNYNDLLQGAFVLCKSCGRILYLPE